jgi:hypothetical protein
MRCLRDADSSVTIAGRTFPLCSAHDQARWEKFLEGPWLYVLDVSSEPSTRANPISLRGNGASQG